MAVTWVGNITSVYSGPLVFSFVGFAMAVSQAVSFLLVSSAGGITLEMGFSTLGVMADGLILAVSVFPFELPPVLRSGRR